MALYLMQPKSFSELKSHFFSITSLCLGFDYAWLCFLNLNFFKKTNSEWLRHIYRCPYFWRTGEVRRVDRPKGRKGVVSGSARATWPGGVDRGTLPETATRVLTFFHPGLVLQPRTSREAELDIGPSARRWADAAYSEEPCGSEAVW